MTSCGGYLQRALRTLLPLYVDQVRQVCRQRAYGRLRPGENLRTAEMIGERDQASGRQDVDVGSGPGGLGPTVCRADQPLAERIRADRRRKRAGHRRQGAIEVQFANDDIARQGIGRNGAKGRHETERDGQIEVRASAIFVFCYPDEQRSMRTKFAFRLVGMVGRVAYK